MGAEGEVAAVEEGHFELDFFAEGIELAEVIGGAPAEGFLWGACECGLEQLAARGGGELWEAGGLDHETGAAAVGGEAGVKVDGGMGEAFGELGFVSAGAEEEDGEAMEGGVGLFFAGEARGAFEVGEEGFGAFEQGGVAIESGQRGHQGAAAEAGLKVAGVAGAGGDEVFKEADVLFEVGTGACGGLAGGGDGLAGGAAFHGLDLAPEGVGCGKGGGGAVGTGGLEWACVEAGEEGREQKGGEGSAGCGAQGGGSGREGLQHW